MNTFLLEMFLPLASFVAAVALTPGPNNLLLATVGMRFGVKAAVPHLIGIKLGVVVLLLFTAVGLNQLLIRQPAILTVIKIFGSIYLLYLSWKILGTNVEDNGGIGKPLTVWNAFLFQFSNPKAWMMAPTALGIGLSLVSTMSQAILILLFTFATVGVSCNLVWVLGGMQLQKLYYRPKCRMVINVILSMITLLTVLWFWIP